MRILFLTANLKQIGGIESYNKNLLQVLQELNQEIYHLSLKDSKFL